ncbi:MAG: penicillin-binding protein 2 [Acidobacteriota bacterium]
MNEVCQVSRGRRRLVSLGLLLFAVLLSWRLFVLQISHHQELAARAVAQSNSVITIPGPRGEIVDRSTNRYLANSIPCFVLAAEPVRIGVPGLAALERAAGVVPGRLTSRATHPWLDVRRDCDDDCIGAVQALIAQRVIPAGTVHWSRGFKRSYPHAGQASHVLGFVNLDGTLTEGIERVYDDGLRSRSAKLLRITDAKQKPLEHVSGDATPPPAATLQLALDLRLQMVLEDALERAATEHGARGARGVVLDPDNGDVLALAAYPSFDSNRFNKASDELRRNPVISIASEPGSVMKPFTAAALLEAGLYRPGESVDCERGQWKKGSRVIHDTHPHGVLTLPEVIEVSSNIGIVKFSQRLRSADFYRVLLGLGLGARTGIDLPAESAGVLAKPELWKVVDHDSIAFGHSLSATTLQIAVAMSTIANGGFRVTPRLGLSWELPDGTRQEIPRPAPERAISAQTSWQVRQFLRRVVEEKHGTGKNAAVEGFFVAGKTGTAELITDGRYNKRENLASFVGFAPVDHPVAVVVISLEAPKIGGRTGGATAAPAFSTVLAEVLRLRRVAPDNLPPADPDQDGSAVVAHSDPKHGARGVRG